MTTATQSSDTAVIASDDSGTRSVRWALAALSMSMLLSALGTSSANVALPTLARELESSFQDVQWVVLAYLLAITTLIVSVGRLGDLIGRRRLLLAGLALYTLASLACALATELWMLIAARALQGLGAAAMMALTMASVGEAVPAGQTGRAMGLLGTTSAIGTALGPSLGGALIGALGWRSIFLINLPLGLCAMLLAYRSLPADPSRTARQPARFDLLGTLLLVAALAAYALAMTTGHGHFGWVNGALLITAAIGAGLFAMAEAQVAAPLVRLPMLRNPDIRVGFASSLLVTTVVMATLVVGPFYLSGALTLDAVQVGLVMSVGPIVAALVGVPAGRLVDRWGSRRMTIAGLIAVMAGSALLSLLPMRLGVPGYLLPMLGITAGYALFQAANNTAVMTSTRADERGVVSGLLNLSRNLGLITGASAMGAVFHFGSASSGLTAASPIAIALGMHLTFAVAAVLIVLALVIVVANRAPAGSPVTAQGER